MKNRILRRAIKMAAWVAVIGAAVFFLQMWGAPGTCLDFGGSFNYGTWECTDEVNKFVDVRFYEFKSFWMFIVALVGACVLQWTWSVPSKKSSRSTAREDARGG